MDFAVKDAIRSRKSVRTFDGRALEEADRRAIETYVGALKNPFGVPVEFRVLDAKEHGLSSAVILGAELYLAAKVRRIDQHEIAFGYSFEAACLYAQSLGVGTVMLAASLSRAAFERAMEVGPDEVMPVASPLGYPAAKRSIRETLMRKAIGADGRAPFSELFFDGAFDKGLDPAGVAANTFAEALELMRWAPSAANKQPWRAVVQGDEVHFFENKTMRESALGDVQKVDMGIGLCHFDLVMRENGHCGSFVRENPGIEVPQGVEYVVSYKLNS